MSLTLVPRILFTTLYSDLSTHLVKYFQLQHSTPYVHRSQYLFSGTECHTGRDGTTSFFSKVVTRGGEGQIYLGTPSMIRS